MNHCLLNIHTASLHRSMMLLLIPLLTYTTLHAQGEELKQDHRFSIGLELTGITFMPVMTSVLEEYDTSRRYALQGRAHVDESFFIQCGIADERRQRDFPIRNYFNADFRSRSLGIGLGFEYSIFEEVESVVYIMAQYFNGSQWGVVRREDPMNGITDMPSGHDLEGTGVHWGLSFSYPIAEQLSIRLEFINVFGRTTVLESPDFYFAPYSGRNIASNSNRYFAFGMQSYLCYHF